MCCSLDSQEVQTCRNLPTCRKKLTAPLTHHQVSSVRKFSGSFEFSILLHEMVRDHTVTPATLASLVAPAQPPLNRGPAAHAPRAREGNRCRSVVTSSRRRASPARLPTSVAPWCGVGSPSSRLWWTPGGEGRSRAAASRRFPVAGAAGRGPDAAAAATGDVGRGEEVSSAGGGGPGGGSGLHPARPGRPPSAKRLAADRAVAKHAGRSRGLQVFPGRTEAISSGVLRRSLSLGVWWLLLASLSTKCPPDGQ